jgi:hypothetical protein
MCEASAGATSLPSRVARRETQPDIRTTFDADVGYAIRHLKRDRP